MINGNIGFITCGHQFYFYAEKQVSTNEQSQPHNALVSACGGELVVDEETDHAICMVHREYTNVDIKDIEVDIGPHRHTIKMSSLIWEGAAFYHQVSIAETPIFALVLAGITGPYIGRIYTSNSTSPKYDDIRVNKIKIKNHFVIDKGCQGGDSGSPVLLVGERNQYSIIGIVRGGDMVRQVTIVVPIDNIRNTVKNKKKEFLRQLGVNMATSTVEPSRNPLQHPTPPSLDDLIYSQLAPYPAES